MFGGPDLHQPLNLPNDLFELCFHLTYQASGIELDLLRQILWIHNLSTRTLGLERKCLEKLSPFRLNHGLSDFSLLKGLSIYAGHVRGSIWYGH